MRSIRHRSFLRLASAYVFILTLAHAAHAAESLSDLTGPWQLVIDDFLIATRSGLSRTYHPFIKYAGNPVLQADQPWEGTNVYLYGTVLPTEDHSGYRMWYHVYSKAEATTRSCYATSADGIHWVKPSLGIVSYNDSTANNIHALRGGPVSVIHTPFNADPSHRYTHLAYANGGYQGAWAADGVHWTDVPTNPLVDGGDVGHAAWDPLAGRYIGYFKLPAYVDGLRRRAVGFSETTDFTAWPVPYLIMAPDAIDDRWAPAGTIQRTHFYGFCPFAYESLYIGFLWIYRATDSEGTYDGTIYVELVSSRDGVHWTREEGDRPPILPLGPAGAWDDSMVFTSTHPLKEGDTLRLYYGGFDDTHVRASYWHAKIGLATLRKDGFASLDAGPVEGILTTRKLVGTGGALHVNAKASGGWLKVEVLDQDSLVIPGYGRDDCIAVTGDDVDQIVTWTGDQELPASSPIRLRFILQNASLYSFNAGPAVAVTDPVTISRQPDACTVRAGGTAVLTVAVDGFGPLSYQWQKGSSDLIDDGHVTGAATPTLAITDVSAADAAPYRCSVSSPFGSAISDEAVLTVRAQVDYDLDGDVDMEDFGHFQACLSGRLVEQQDPDCQWTKLDLDSDVDQYDLAVFLQCLGGANLPAAADCAD